MVKGQSLNLPNDVAHVIDHLERHCMAPDGSLMSKSSYNGLQFAREEMCRERERYLEAMAIYSEAAAMVEEYHQTFSVLGGISSTNGLYPLKNSPQVYETLEHRMVVAEAAQRLRLPLISKEGELHDEDVDKMSIMSPSSVDSTSTSSTVNATNYATPRSSISAVNSAFAVVDPVEPGIGGAPDRFLGITPVYLRQTQLQETPSSLDMIEYSLSLSLEMEDRLKLKCDTLSDAFVLDETEDSFSFASDGASSQLPERVKLIIEEIEREEAALRKDLHSADRKFAEYYNVLEHILEVLIKLIKDLKLEHQHNYDEMQNTWFCKRCETMNAKLGVLKHVLLLETYTRDSIPALHKIRKYLIEATEEASVVYNKAVTRMHEYQGVVDANFDDIAIEYQDIVQKLENMQWTIQQVEMDLQRLPDNPTI